MHNVENLNLHRIRRAEVLASEIVVALRALGGSAHRDLIAATVAARRSTNGPALKPDERREVAAMVHQTLQTQEHEDGLFLRPFGPGSNRWSLRERPTAQLPLFDEAAAQ